MEKLCLGAQMYTLREYCRTPKMYEKSMRKLSEMGYKYYQFSGVTDDVTPQMIKEISERYDLKCTLTHWDDSKIISDTERVIEDHNIFGCEGIGIGGMPGEFRNYEGYEKFLDKYGRAIETIGKSGKTFCYHNHWFEFERYEKTGKTGMEMLLDMTNKDAFKLTFDTAWAHRAGVDCADFIHKHADRIFAVHLKDLTIIDNELTVTEMLTGNMCFDPIIKACVEENIKWQFVEQDWVRINAYDSMKISYDNLMQRYANYLQ